MIRVGSVGKRLNGRKRLRAWQGRLENLKTPSVIHISCDVDEDDALTTTRFGFAGEGRPTQADQFEDRDPRSTTKTEEQHAQDAQANEGASQELDEQFLVTQNQVCFLCLLILPLCLTRCESAV